MIVFGIDCNLMLTTDHIHPRERTFDCCPCSCCFSSHMTTVVVFDVVRMVVWRFCCLVLYIIVDCTCVSLASISFAPI